MKECRLEENLKHCNCSYEPCDRKGLCCQCIRYHLRLNELPACCFPDAAEKNWDRSIKHFIRIHQKSGG